MFNAIAVSICLLDAWGMIGIWTQKFGFHNDWEVWVRPVPIPPFLPPPPPRTSLTIQQLYQAFYGLLVCPWYSYSQILISEVTPRGHEFLFFSLFSIIGKTSSFIGPLVSSAIIDASTHNNASMPFYFLFALSVFSAGGLALWLDLGKSRGEQERFLSERERSAGTERGSV